MLRVAVVSLFALEEDAASIVLAVRRSLYPVGAIKEEEDVEVEENKLLDDGR